VSETLARLSWPGESAVGRRVRDDEDDPWITVIGVARDVHHQGLATEIAPMLYVPALQSERTAGNWVLKTRGDGGPVLAAAREAVKQTSRDVLVSRTAVLSEEISARVSLPRFRTLLIGALAALAALLALIGIYGVMVFTVTERMREFGVRLALGARPGDLIRTVLGRGVALAALGMAIGVLGVLTAGRVLESFLFGVQPTDPVTLAVASAAIVVVGVAASLVPARRAASVDPMSTLKAD
jgi:predicted lysophospholipase L1 biosynthesis ABC-type transport system permease subunit